MTTPDHPPRLLTRLALVAHAHPWAAIAVSAVLSVAALLGARGLAIDSDLLTLLPSDFASVRAIHRVEERLGGLGWVIVVGEDANPDQLRAFADAAAEKLAAMPEIEFVDHRRESEFFESRALYYLHTDALARLETLLDDRIKWEKRRRNPLFIDLDDEPAPTVDPAEIAREFAASPAARLAKGGDPTHYLDAETRFVAVLAKPKHTSSDLVYARTLDDKVRAEIASIPTAAYGPGFRWELTGAFEKKLDQAALVSSDIGAVSWVALVLVLAIALAYFRSIVGAGLALIPVGAGVIWTYGVAGSALGTVSLLTACLGAIMGGLGVETGVHLVSRYSALRNTGRSSLQATAETFQETGHAALASTVVAAVAFGGLGISKFRAFREFGLLAAAGLALVFLAFVLLLPACFALAARFGWMPAKISGTRLSPVLSLIERRPAPFVLVSVGLVAVALIASPGVRFEADFAALEDTSLRSYQLDARVNALLGYAQNPAIVPTKDVADEALVADEMRAQIAIGGPTSTIDSVATLGDLVPPDQAAKVEILERMRVKVAKLPATLLPEGLLKWRKLLEMKPFVRAELPDSIRRWFGRGDGGAVLVFPKGRSNDGNVVRQFAKELRTALGRVGGQQDVAGESLVLADILSLVSSEAPRVGLTVVLLVFVVLTLMLGSAKVAALSLIPTLMSMGVLAGVFDLAGIPLDFLNIIAVPVLVGTTVDAGVHLAVSGTGGDSRAVYRSIAGGLMTNAVGFGALLVASHPGPVSIGRLASLGFAVNALIVLVSMPACLAYWGRLFGPKAMAPIVAPADEAEHAVV